MKKPTVFDVLVVYTSTIATDASEVKPHSSGPFSIESERLSYNDAYSHLLHTCHEAGLSAAFSTSAEITAAGTVSSFWTYSEDKWTAVSKPGYSRNIYDKFSPHTLEAKLRRKMLFNSELVTPFNNPRLSALFFDKLTTYQQLKEWSIPTVSLESDKTSDIQSAIHTLSKLVQAHPHTQDFGGEFILKDQFGSGGIDIYLIDKDPIKQIQEILNTQDEIHFILQPLVKFTRGFDYQGRPAAADIRLIFNEDEIILCYLRIAKPDDFRCNQHQGASLIYANPQDLHPQIIAKAHQINQALQTKTSLYALDFLISDLGNVYFLEGNINPGINWDQDHPTDELMTKKLIDHIVGNFSNRIDRETALSTPLPFNHPPLLNQI